MIIALLGCIPAGTLTWEEEELLAPLGLPRERPDLSAVLPEADGHDPAALFALGKALFVDPGLSVPVTEATVDGGTAEVGSAVSCVDCHDPAASVADPRGAPTSQGAGAGPTGRNALTLLNAALEARWGWCGQESTLFSMVTFALETERAMNRKDPAGTAAFVQGSYAPLYDAAFGAGASDGAPDGVHEGVVLALAVYVSQLVSAPSDLDRWADGDLSALPEEQIPGARLFVGRAGCVRCHSGPLLSDQQNHNIGLASPKDDNCDGNAFRTPTLRGIASSAPYMHDGLVTRLDGADGVLWHYASGGGAVGAGVEDPRTQAPLDLSEQDLDDLLVFLSSLRGWDPDAADEWWSPAVGDVRLPGGGR